MVITLLFAALQASAVAPAADVPTCALVTPRGDAIGFVLRSEATPGEISLSATANAVWPAGTIVATRQGGGGSTLRYAIGAGPGLMLELGAPMQGRPGRAATIFLPGSGGAEVPAAYGFCEPRPASGERAAPGPDRSAVGADHAAFDPSHWPDADCGLLLTDGRRLRLVFRDRNDSQVTLRSAGLWSGRPVEAGLRVTSESAPRTGTFAHANGLRGAFVIHIDTGRAARLVRLQSVGDPALPNAEAYAICGYNQLVRRRG